MCIFSALFVLLSAHCSESISLLGRPIKGLHLALVHTVAIDCRRRQNADISHSWALGQSLAGINCKPVVLWMCMFGEGIIHFQLLLVTVFGFHGVNLSTDSWHLTVKIQQ